MPALTRLFSGLCTLLCLSSLPFILPGCSFNPSGENDFGPRPRTSAIFCDIERGARRCAEANEDLTGAVDRFHYFRQGYWPGEARTVVVDNSTEALARCGGRPEVIEFRGPFPAGQAKCVNPDWLGTGIGRVGAACVDVCEDLQGTAPVPGDRPCEQVVLPSWRATAPFAGACTDADTLRPDFADPRISTPPPTPSPTPVVPQPVVWRDVITPATLAVNGNSLRKTGTALAWDSGAASSRLLLNGEGFVEFVATETTLRRLCGLSIGGFPDTNADVNAVSFGVLLRDDGTLSVIESGTGVTLPATVTYASGNRIRVGVVGGAVEYAKDGQVFYRSTAPVMYPLRVDTSFLDTSATITDARTSF